MNQTPSPAGQADIRIQTSSRTTRRLAALAVAVGMILAAAACTPGVGAIGDPPERQHGAGPSSGIPEVHVPNTHAESTMQAAGIQVGSYSTMDDYLQQVVTDVDQYWSTVFEQAALPEPYVYVSWPAPGEQVLRSCTDGAGSRLSDDATASYCPLDDEIVISQQFAIDLWNGDMRGPDGQVADQTPGDFSVAYVVAHEYAHQLQDELGLPQKLDLQTRAFELHADCWSGVWANSAYWNDILDSGDVEEAITTASLVGDSSFGSPDHHGTSAERVDAFLTGYNSGQPISCDAFLVDM